VTAVHEMAASYGPAPKLAPKLSTIYSGFLAVSRAPVALRTRKHARYSDVVGWRNSQTSSLRRVQKSLCHSLLNDVHSPFRPSPLILDFTLESAQRSRAANVGRPQVKHSSTNTPPLRGSSSSVPYFYATSLRSFSSFDSTSQPSGGRASSGSASTNSSGSSRVLCSTTSSSTPSLKPLSNGSSADLKRIRPSQRRAFLEAAATTVSPTSSKVPIKEKKHINRYHTHSQINPDVETPMRPTDNLDTLHRMLQSVGKSWSASNVGSSTTTARSGTGSGAKSSKPPSRVVTPVLSTSKASQSRGSRKAPVSSLKNSAALPASLPSRSIPPHIQAAVAGMEAIESPLKEAVAKLESPARVRPKKSIGNSGNGLMLPPPLPSNRQPHHRSTFARDLSASDMSFELEATKSQTVLPCKPKEELEPSHGRIKADVKDAEDSYDDLSFVDVDGLMEVDLDEQSSSSPAIEQPILCTTQESKKMPPSWSALSTETQKRSVAGAIQVPQHSKPVIKHETFFSTPIQVAPFAPSVSTSKALRIRRVHSSPASGHKELNSSASASSAKPGTAPPRSHSSTRGPNPFKVPWARNDTSATTLELSVVPELRRPAPKRRGVMDIDTSVDSSFSFDDMDPDEVERLLSQIGA
jgi:hypothetical protein